jgi:TolB-like protein
MLVVSLLASSAFAGEPRKEEPRKKVAVLDFTGDAKLATALTRLVTAELGKDSRLEILSREDVTALLGLERQRQLLGCDNSCLTEVGSALDARWLVNGSISALGAGFLVTAQLLDTSQARILNRVVLRPRSSDEMMSQAGALARELLSEPATLVLYNQRPGASVFLDDKFLGKLPLDAAPLSVTGRRSLRVEGGEYVPFQQEIELVAGRSSRVSLELDTYGELEARSRARKAWATGVTVFGVAAGAGSAAFFVHGLAANRTYQALDPLDATQAQLDAAADEVRWRFGAGYVVGGVALTALVTGIILFVVDPHGDKLARVKSW